MLADVQPTSTAVLLLSIAMVVALAVRRLKVPYTVALVAVGLCLAQAHLFDLPVLSKGLVYGLVLPGLLFEAAYHLRFDEFMKQKLSISALAVPGVLVCTVIAGLVVARLPLSTHSGALGVSHGLVFAAIVAATDPIAVVALFKTVGAPRQLGVLIEGESLLNDGTAAVLYSILLDFSGPQPTPWTHAPVEFLRAVSVGVASGLVFAFGASLVMKRLNEPLIETTLTSIVAYGSFAVAEHFGGSGVLATVSGGMLCGSYAREVAMSDRTRNAVSDLWEYVSFVLNSVVFLVMGASVKVSGLLGVWRHIVVGYVAVLVARALVVWVVQLALRPTAERFPGKWGLVVTWSGLRGALSMLLALSLPGNFVDRELLIAMTFGVVLLSLFVQGLTISPLLSRLQLGQSADR